MIIRSMRLSSILVVSLYHEMLVALSFFFFFLKQHRYTSLYTGIKEERARAQLLSIDSIDANIVVGVVDHVAIMPVSQVKRINDDESFLSRARLLDKTLGRSRCVFPFE